MLKDMKRMGGFTLVELVITIAVMLIITLMAVANFTGSQMNARDADRKTDVEAIAQRLDSLYKTGMTFSDLSTLAAGTYPTAVQMRDATKRSEIFKELNISGRTVAGYTPVGPATDSILVPASTDNPATFEPTGVNQYNQYAYVPQEVTDTSGTLDICEDSPQECRRFVIRYKLEAGGGTQEIRSKNR